MPRTPTEVVRAVTAEVSRLISGGLTDREQAAAFDELAGLYAEDTDVRHPFAPLGDTPLRTRAEVRAHFVGAPDRTPAVDRFEVVDQVVHRTDDPEVVIQEFSYAITRDGRDFTLPCVFITRVRDGLIVESRDYAHHLAGARAFGRLDELLDNLATEG
ncbi:nuclear transport factor 2 family protein [Actinokineospora auranticolor]|uniref:Ketosteroid isomerase-like protein n=1 Tax=Actinokineospora auranticolor TaxID=155976 RepID=A0A2S6GIJ1_9PSEU|nr:nuclear transport factor 2 family protein [Actinokineospora auranticolor]PPK65027.1 ketosteroid isomerase-like protein [Actinokineospora auranticolor]